MKNFKVSADNEFIMPPTRLRPILAIRDRVLKGMFEMAAQESTISVAEFLEGVGARGVPGQCGECVLADWIRQICEAEIHDYAMYQIRSIAVDQEAIRFGIDYTDSNGFVVEVDHQFPMPVDSPIYRFVREFDDHAFPELFTEAYAENLEKLI